MEPKSIILVKGIRLSKEQIYVEENNSSLNFYMRDIFRGCAVTLTRSASIKLAKAILEHYKEARDE